MSNTIEATQFEIDFLPGQRFAGFTTGDDWNGFACPRFNFEQAQKVAAAWNKLGRNARYNKDEDAFEFEPIDNSEESETFHAETINGLNLYLIGAGSWIWSEASE